MRQGDHSGSPLPVRERHRDGPHCLPLMPVNRRTPSLTSEQEQTRLAQQDPKQLLGAACVSIASYQDLGTNSLPQFK